MKTWLKHILMTATVAIFFAGALAIRRSCREIESSMTCRGIEISIEDTHKFVTEDDIRQYISKSFGKMTGCKLDSIPLSDIERILDDKSTILKSQAWYTSDSLLHVSITQRHPVARMMKEGTGFYVDDRGFIFPLQDNYIAPVPVVTGHIPVHAGGSYKGSAASEAEKKWIASMLKTLSAIGNSRIWKDSFPSVTVKANHDIVLEWEGGQEKIIFGKPDNNQEKISRIKTYYSIIKPNMPEGFYRSVNVKYNGQIVCRQQ